MLELGGIGDILLQNNNDYSMKSNATGTANSLMRLDTNDDLQIGLGGEINDVVFSNNVGIGTTSPLYPLQVNGTSSGISIFSEGNVSATGYNTRTSVFDKSKNVWDYIKDADYYLTFDEIDHSRFYGYTGVIPITDYSKPITEEYTECINHTIPENYTYITVECDYQKEGVGYNYVCGNVTNQGTRNEQICHNETKYNYVWNEEESYYDRVEYQEEVCEDLVKEVCEDKTRITYPYTKQIGQISIDKEIDLLRQGVYELKRELCEVSLGSYNFC